jgi:hypothetical protein
MVDHFEVGHYYRWVGPMGFSWSFEEMGEWADGKPRECIYKHSEGGYWFEKIDGGIWCYDAMLRYFVEVSPVPDCLFNCRCSLADLSEDKKSRHDRRKSILARLTTD